MVKSVISTRPLRSKSALPSYPGSAGLSVVLCGKDGEIGDINDGVTIGITLKEGAYIYRGGRLLGDNHTFLNIQEGMLTHYRNIKREKGFKEFVGQ